jgi:mannose-1-phosphate guanylyltransferase/mannose-1-phosphate guanylyltransferase/mannose-6-phosphate isomerase
VGSWDEVARIQEVNPSAEATTSPHTVEVQSKNNFIMTQVQEKTYALVGVQDLMIVDTADALLVARRGESQLVKEAQSALAKAGKTVATQHPFEYRPWGYFEVLRDTPAFKSKVIRVEPGQQLSLQSHAKRAEHWIVLRGTAEVVLNDQVLRPRAGEHVFIPMGAKHRMRNAGTDVVEFVEVQVGTYFGEDDIVRYQDDYQRK